MNICVVGAGRAGVVTAAVNRDWNEFRLLNLERLGSVMNRPALFDGCNFLEPARIRRHGFECRALGLDWSGTPRPAGACRVLPLPPARAAKTTIELVTNGHRVADAAVPSGAGRPNLDATGPEKESALGTPALGLVPTGTPWMPR